MFPIVFLFLFLRPLCKKKYQALKQLLSENPKNIVITVHRGPDGDAMGSGLGAL